MGTHAAIAVGLIVYAAVMLAVSLYWMGKVRKPADYLIGGRNLPFWVLTGNITAGCIGTGVIIGASGLAYGNGWAGSAWPLGLGIGTALAGLMFASMRRFKFMTLSEEISSYYGGRRVVGGVLQHRTLFSFAIMLADRADHGRRERDRSTGDRFAAGVERAGRRPGHRRHRHSRRFQERGVH